MEDLVYIKAFIPLEIHLPIIFKNELFEFNFG